MKYSCMTTLLLTSVLLTGEVQASELVYHGLNPDISPSANPANGANIQFEAGLSKPAASTASTQESESQLLKDSVVSGLSSTYQQILTGSTSGSGQLSFGDGSYATYSTSNNVRTITFYDLGGQSTTISFPLN